MEGSAVWLLVWLASPVLWIATYWLIALGVISAESGAWIIGAFVIAAAVARGILARLAIRQLPKG